MLTYYYATTEKRSMDMEWRRCQYVSFGACSPPFEPTVAFMRDMLGRYKTTVPTEGAATLNHITHVELFNMFKYEAAKGNDHFHGHADCWNDASATRQVSLIAYLSNVEEGGETVFPSLGLSFKPQLGDVLMFPSNWQYYHLAKPPTVGDKLILVGWYHFGPSTGYTSFPL